MMDMPQIFVAECTDPTEALAMSKAKEIGDELYKHYPDHLWVVQWGGKAFIVKNLSISSFYGFVLPDTFSATDLTKKAIEAGGELLERAGMKRGRWDGQFAQSLEGSDPRFFKSTIN